MASEGSSQPIRSVSGPTYVAASNRSRSSKGFFQDPNFWYVDRSAPADHVSVVGIPMTVLVFLGALAAPSSCFSRDSVDMLLPVGFQARVFEDDGDPKGKRTLATAGES